MEDLIAVPLKKPSEVDVAKPLKNLIQSTYSTADKPEDYSEAIQEFSKLRNNALWRAFDKYESSLDLIYSYYDQLNALEEKIPPQEVQIPFKWKDAFDKGSIFGSRMSLTISSLGYEKVCVLFNIAALQSNVATSQGVESDEALQLAAKLFQQSAGVFGHLKGTVMSAILQDPTPDLNPETLGALSTLMLAQAQEVIVRKAIHDEMKDNIIAKIANQCQELYNDAQKLLQKESLRHLWDWMALVYGKQSGYQAISEYYQSLVCKSKKNVGEEICRLEKSAELFKVAQQKSGKPQLFEDFVSKVNRNLTEAKKDNDFIYHERIPDIKSVEPVGKLMLVKSLPLATPMSPNFKDLFCELVPVPVHQALAAYDVRKSDLVNTEIMRLRESTQLLNSTLASLNLPAAIEVTKGSELPQSIVEKSESVRQLGGISKLENMMTELPNLLKLNKELLDETVRMLNEEQKADDTLREQFKERWNRTPSDKLTEMFRSNAAKYKTVIENAVQADASVREKFEKNRKGMELLSKSLSEIQAAVPAGSGGTVTDSSAVQTLRKLMEEVETLKAEREVVESELKSATLDMKSTFLRALAKDGAISEPQISVESLGQVYGPLQKQVRESLERQEALVANIQRAHSVFTEGGNAGSGERENVMCQLAAAHGAFCELQSNLQEGTKFYNDLTTLLLQFSNKVSDFCFARKTEKEELMKDLTENASRQAPAATPSVPTHYNQTPEVKKEVPPRPPPPSMAPTAQQVPNLPYPTYVQGMPVPYGATTSAPYPTYVPPPMPQGYNPYGTMPYPAAPYNYPGGFPQAPPSYPSYPGQPGQPGGYPHQPPPSW